MTRSKKYTKKKYKKKNKRGMSVKNLNRSFARGGYRKPLGGGDKNSGAVELDTIYEKPKFKFSVECEDNFNSFGKIKCQTTDNNGKPLDPVFCSMNETGATCKNETATVIENNINNNNNNNDDEFEEQLAGISEKVETEGNTVKNPEWNLMGMNESLNPMGDSPENKPVERIQAGLTGMNVRKNTVFGRKLDSAINSPMDDNNDAKKAAKKAVEADAMQQEEEQNEINNLVNKAKRQVKNARDANPIFFKNGGRRTTKRKTTKRKTAKRKTAKHKTAKRKTTKRKTTKRKNTKRRRSRNTKRCGRKVARKTKKI